MLRIGVNAVRETTLGINDKKEYKITITHLGGDEHHLDCDKHTHVYKNVKVTLGFNESPELSNCGVRIRDPAIFKPNPVLGKPLDSDIAPVVINIEDLESNTVGEDIIKEIDMEIETGVDPTSEESWGKTTPPDTYFLQVAISYKEEVISNSQGEQKQITVEVTDD